MSQKRKNDKPPTPEQFYKGLAKEHPNMLVCRSYGHAWAPYTVQPLGRTFEITAQCSRCLALRKEAISATGMKLTESSYDYKDGYPAEGVGASLRGTRGLAKLTLLKNTRTYSPLIDPEEQQ